MATGIICEYNPFHNGHIYHLNKVKELVKDDILILVLSGNFTQRGYLSLIEKYDKAKLALLYGVDLVIELPYNFATQSSDIFAKGSIEILNELKCNKIVFGSESNNIKDLKELANIQINNKKYDSIVKNELNKGINYPTAMSNALKEITNKTVKEANDLLALSYIKEIIKNDYNIEPITIKRTNNYNSKDLTGGIDSATSIREALKNNIDVSSSIPKEVKNYLININRNKIFELLKYKILSDKNLSIYLDVDEGIDNKIKKEIINSNDLDDFIKKIKSKRYTYNKITRMLSHILCSYTKEENETILKYIRVLGFSKKGKEYLNSIKKDINYPIITNINKKNIDLLELEIRTDNIYYLITESNKNIFSSKPIQKGIN